MTLANSFSAATTLFCRGLGIVETEPRLNTRIKCIRRIVRLGWRGNPATAGGHQGLRGNLSQA